MKRVEVDGKLSGLVKPCTIKRSANARLRKHRRHDAARHITKSGCDDMIDDEA